MSARWGAWLLTLAACAPRGEPLDGLPAAETVVLAWRVDGAWRGVVRGDARTEIPRGAEDLRAYGFDASPAALGVRPGERLPAADQSRPAPVPDWEWRWDELRREVAPPEPMAFRLPACPAHSPTPAGYCTCGDGSLDSHRDESCDDANSAAGDGCAGCRVEPGWTCAEPPCRTMCGDRIRAGDEECDEVSDGCDRQTCEARDGWVCDATGCHRCGDGNRTGDEECEVKDGAYPAGCDAETCKARDGWVCDATGCRAERCGDLIRAGDEVCDEEGDGCDRRTCKARSGWDCSSDVRCQPACGDGAVVGDETCDDGNHVRGDGCNAACQIEDGWLCPPTGGRCNSTCGDEAVVGAETCDDGNREPGDGCGNTCQLEPSWLCPRAGGACRLSLPLEAGPIDLGWLWGPTAKTTEIRNVGLDSVVVEEIEVNGPFTSSTTCGRLHTGQSCTATVHFGGDLTQTVSGRRLDVRFSVGSDAGRLEVPVEAKACETLPDLRSPLLAFDEQDVLHVVGAPPPGSGQARLARLDPEQGLVVHEFPATAKDISSIALRAGAAYVAGSTLANQRSSPAVRRIDPVALVGSGVQTMSSTLAGAFLDLAFHSGGAIAVGLGGQGEVDSALVQALDPVSLAAGPRRSFATPWSSVARGVALDPNGVIHVVGEVAGPIPGEPSLGGREGFRARFSTTLEPLGVQSITTAGDDSISDVAATAAGVFVVGWTSGELPGQPKPGGEDVIVAQLGDDGVPSWSRLFGGPGDEEPVALLAVESSALIVAYATAGATSVVAELDPASGSCRSQRTLEERLTNLAIDGAGRIFAAGRGQSRTGTGWCRAPSGGFVTYVGDVGALPDPCP